VRQDPPLSALDGPVLRPVFVVNDVQKRRLTELDIFAHIQVAAHLSRLRPVLDVFFGAHLPLIVGEVYQPYDNADRRLLTVRVNRQEVVLRAGQQLTVTYPLRIAEIKETVGSLDGTEYTQKWRANTIVDIASPGKWIPMFNRPEPDTERLP